MTAAAAAAVAAAAAAVKQYPEGCLYVGFCPAIIELAAIAPVQMSLNLKLEDLLCSMIIKNVIPNILQARKG